MKVTDSLKNRCGIFLFYDRDGIVDDYIIYMLKDIRKSLSHLLVVCNGEPGKEGLERLQAESDEVLIRANHGFDVGGYREGLFYIGFKELAKYDEVVLFNYTFFGGIYPFAEMFEKMSQMDLDFWGITKHHKVEYDPYGAIKYGYMPEHIQSHFLVIRKSLLCSDDYKEFIISMKNPASYVESICDYETILTKHFEDLGYKWDVYVDSGRYERYSYCPVMFYIKELLEKDRCPIVKRRSFFTPYKDYLINTCGESSVDAYEYIRKHTNYDVNMIWDNILRIENMSDVQKIMQFNYCLSSDVRFADEAMDEAATVIWVKDTSNIVFYQEYLKQVTDCYNVCLYGTKENVSVAKQMIAADVKVETRELQLNSMQEFLSAIKKNKVDHVQYYAVGIIDTVEKIKPYSNTISNVYKDWCCTIPSEEYLANVKLTFAENPRMGLGIPPMPDFGEYFAKYSDGWNGRFEDVQVYLNQISVKVNIKKEVAPLMATTGNFWISAKVLFGEKMEKALAVRTDDEVFLYALTAIAQCQGYYTGVLYSNAYAEIEMTNSDYMMRELNKVVFEKYGANYHDVVLDRVKNNIFERNPEIIDNNWKARTKRKLKKILPQEAYLKGKKVYFRLRGREFKD